MKKFAGTVTGKVTIGAMVVFALVTVAFVSPRLVNAASMPNNSGIQTAVTHVTYEEALEHLTGQAEVDKDSPEFKDADSKGDQIAVNGQGKENETETSDTKETVQATSNAGVSISGQSDNQGSGIGQELSQTILTDVENTLASHGIDISIPHTDSNH